MESKNEIVDKLLCISCLCIGRTLHKITNQKVQKFYLDTLNEIPLCNLPESCPSVCWECATMLTKLVAFKEQVKDSYRILQTYTSENLHECLLTDVTRTPRLKLHHNDPITILPELDEAQKNSITESHVDESHKSRTNEYDSRINVYGSHKSKKKVFDSHTNINDSHVEENCVKYENDDVSYSGEPEVQSVYVKEEMNNECDDYDLTNSDDDLSNTSTREIETEIKTLLSKKEKKKQNQPQKSKLKATKKIVQKPKTDSKIRKQTKSTDNKIITIELTYDEMLAERAKEAKKESFIKAQYKCESCILAFNYEKSYRAHVNARHSSSLGNYSCPICKTVIASVESFTAHYKRHMKRYECSICEKRTLDLKVMQQHYYSTHEITLKQYTCNVCGFISNSIDSHRYHKDSHKARVQCPECYKTFSHRAGLMNHRLAVHEFKNAFPCSVCGKVFRWKTSLNRHLELHSSKNNKSSQSPAAYCSSCSISFASVSSYQRHMKNSLKHVTPDDLRFICDHCNRKFADKTKLRDHIEEKHLHNTFHCQICQKTFKNRVGLDQHIRNVHNKRPNNKMCHHCGKGFPTKMQLESHIRTHTGERPFICEFCPTTFSQQSNLYKHNRQVHMNIKSKRYPLPKKRKDGTQENMDILSQPLQYNNTHTNNISGQSTDIQNNSHTNISGQSNSHTNISGQTNSHTNISGQTNSHTNISGQTHTNTPSAVVTLQYSPERGFVL